MSQHNADSGKSCPKPQIEHRTLNNLKDVASWDGVLIPSLLAIHLRETDGLPVTDDSAKKVQGLSNNMHHFLPFCRKRSRNKHGKMVINTIKMSQILKHKQVGGTVCANRVSNASPVGDGISKARINDGNKLDQSTQLSLEIIDVRVSNGLNHDTSSESFKMRPRLNWHSEMKIGNLTNDDIDAESMCNPFPFLPFFVNNDIFSF